MPDKRHRTARALSDLCLLGQILLLIGGPKLVRFARRFQ